MYVVRARHFSHTKWANCRDRKRHLRDLGENATDFTPPTGQISGMCRKTGPRALHAGRKDAARRPPPAHGPGGNRHPVNWSIWVCRKPAHAHPPAGQGHSRQRAGPLCHLRCEAACSLGDAVGNLIGFWEELAAASRPARPTTKSLVVDWRAARTARPGPREARSCTRPPPSARRCRGP